MPNRPMLKTAFRVMAVVCLVFAALWVATALLPFVGGAISTTVTTLEQVGQQTADAIPPPSLDAATTAIVSFFETCIERYGALSTVLVFLALSAALIVGVLRSPLWRNL